LIIISIVSSSPNCKAQKKKIKMDLPAHLTVDLWFSLYGCPRSVDVDGVVLGPPTALASGGRRVEVQLMGLCTQRKRID
jgi:hypothetical protein